MGERTSDPKIPILTYHSYRCGVSYAESDHVALAADLRLLSSAGFTIVPLRSIADWTTGERELTDMNPAGISFDDGADFDWRAIDHPLFGPQTSFAQILRDFTEEAGPHEQPFLHATTFVIASEAVRQRLDRLSLHGQGWMSADWWNEAARTGLIEIGNHSWDHNHEVAEQTCARDKPRGTFSVIDTEAECDCEVARATEQIAARAGISPPLLFAYPYGDSSEYLRESYLPRFVQRHGILAAFGASGGFVTRESSRWNIPRLVCGAHWTSPGELRDVLTAAAMEG